MLFTCCRDGCAKENHQPKKTAQLRTHRGSRKLKGYCISRMMATKHKSTGKVVVKYISTHTNHKPGKEEMKHLPLPASVRQEVKDKFAQNVKLDSIIDGKLKFLLCLFSHSNPLAPFNAYINKECIRSCGLCPWDITYTYPLNTHVFHSQGFVDHWEIALIEAGLMKR